jgi:hypothetical protein
MQGTSWGLGLCRLQSSPVFLHRSSTPTYFILYSLPTAWLTGTNAKSSLTLPDRLHKAWLSSGSISGSETVCCSLHFSVKFLQKQGTLKLTLVVATQSGHSWFISTLAWVSLQLLCSKASFSCFYLPNFSLCLRGWIILSQHNVILPDNAWYGALFFFWMWSTNWYSGVTNRLLNFHMKTKGLPTLGSTRKAVISSSTRSSSCGLFQSLCLSYSTYVPMGFQALS